MKSKASLHEHLRTGSNLQPEDFNIAINLAAARLGSYGIFAMTNFEDKRYEQFTSLRGYDRYPIGENQSAIYVPDKMILIVKAQEVPTKQGHLLCLGLGHSQHLKPNQSLEDTIKATIDLGAIRIADHPFFISGIGPYLETHPELIGLFDAIETHNGEAFYGNKNAERFYSSLGWDHYQLGALSSSDGHSFHELAKSWTEINFPDITDSKEFIPSLRKAIKATDLQTNQKNHTSYAGAVKHIAKLAFMAKVAPKLGLA
jgi:hypothetical protein